MRLRKTGEEFYCRRISTKIIWLCDGRFWLSTVSFSGLKRVISLTLSVIDTQRLTHTPPSPAHPTFFFLFSFFWCLFAVWAQALLTLRACACLLGGLWLSLPRLRSSLCLHWTSEHVALCNPNVCRLEKFSHAFVWWKKKKLLTGKLHGFQPSIC